MAAMLWAGAASAQIKGGGYEIDPDTKRPDLEPRSHFNGFYVGGTFGGARRAAGATPSDGGVNVNPHLGVSSRRSSAPAND